MSILENKKQREERLKKNPEQNIQKLWHTYKRYNVSIMGIQKGGKREKETGEIF